jgi:hypothetical protein
MERKVLLEGSKSQIRFIVDGLDHMPDDDVANELRVSMQRSKDAGRVPQWLEDKAIAYAVKYHRQRIGVEKPAGAALAKPHWLVKFMRRGDEPPRPFGKTSAVVCALSREDALNQVPRSTYYPATATRTDKPVTFTHHCSCTKQPEAVAAGGKRRHAKPQAGVGKQVAELNRLLRR